ncbi:hypothetical protein KM043_000834 [Ampulex compressa]|nr:hypothetical protein KM043_000834 [Ampulex compressa]
MFLQKQCYFSQLSRSYPILRHVDVCDRRSFIRAYILDNTYVYALMYIVFYVIAWYANNVSKRIERTNEDLSRIVEDNKAKVNDLTILKNKKAEYEEVVERVKDAQRETTKDLEREMQRLSTEVMATSGRMSELERIVEKMIFSTNALVNPVIDPATGPRAGANLRGERRARSRTSRSSNHPSRRLYHRNLRLGNTGSLSVDRLANGEHRLQLHLQLPRQKSDSSNGASAEVSSETVVGQASKGVGSKYGDYRDGDRMRHRHLRRLSGKMNSRRSSSCSMRKLRVDPLKNITPFTRSVLGLATIFLREIIHSAATVDRGNARYVPPCESSRRKAREGPPAHESQGSDEKQADRRRPRFARAAVTLDHRQCQCPYPRSSTQDETRRSAKILRVDLGVRFANRPRAIELPESIRTEEEREFRGNYTPENIRFPGKEILRDDAPSGARSHEEKLEKWPRHAAGSRARSGGVGRKWKPTESESLATAGSPFGKCIVRRSLPRAGGAKANLRVRGEHPRVTVGKKVERRARRLEVDTI